MKITKKYIPNLPNKFEILATMCINQYVTNVKTHNNGVVEVHVKEGKQEL